MIYAMSRGTPEHARLSANVTAALRTTFKGVCSGGTRSGSLIASGFLDMGFTRPM